MVSYFVTRIKINVTRAMLKIPLNAFIFVIQGQLVTLENILIFCSSKQEHFKNCCCEDCCLTEIILSKVPSSS